MKQRILTPPIGRILQCLMDAQKRGERIIAVSPHYFENPTNHNKPCAGYIVIVEEVDNG